VTPRQKHFGQVDNGISKNQQLSRYAGDYENSVLVALRAAWFW